MKAQPLTVYLPDTRGVSIASYGLGNGKLGPAVYTYSRLPGNPNNPETAFGTCPGSTEECEAICYAKCIVGPVSHIYFRNSMTNAVPDIPADCRLLRLHVSGDFSANSYIRAWRQALEARPDVTCWAYTRSWRVASLLAELELLRALPNVQLFASMDLTTPELPPTGWRRAWIDGDLRADADPAWHAHDDLRMTDDGVVSYVCPEETGRKKDCESCGYCLRGERGDVTFLKH